MWPKYLPPATFACNTFNTPNLVNYSPYELGFGRKPATLKLKKQYLILRYWELLKIITIC